MYFVLEGHRDAFPERCCLAINSPRKVPLVAFTCSTIPDPKTVNSITTQLTLVPH